jgi:release factor H-coupled RctB family protein
MSNVTIISSEKNWLEQDAVRQLNHIGTLPGVVEAVGLPDLHPGKTPVGAAIITEGIIYPHLIGNDIGCGMSMFITDMEKRKIKIDRLIKKAEAIGSLREIPLPQSEYEGASSPLGPSLGTIGGGNHFAELQTTENIFDEETFMHLGYDKSKIMLLVHSGSRGYGQAVLDESIKLYQAQKGLHQTSQAAKEYLAKHNTAVHWAAINRELIAYRTLKALGMSTQTARLTDCTHNSVSIKEYDNKLLYIHRKGVAPVMQGCCNTRSRVLLPTL